MRMIRNLLLMCALPLFAWQVNAQTTVPVYSGTSLPTEQGWKEQKLDATVNSVAATTTETATGGVLNFTSANDANQFSQLMWYKTDSTGLDFDLTKGFTIKVRAQVISADKTAAFNIQGFDKSGKGFRFGILKDSITEQTNPFAATKVIASGLDNSDAVHDFIFSFAPTGVVTVYRDGIAVGTCQMSLFQFDNIIENGGFEDEQFPDFLSNSILERSTTNPFSGQNSLLINSDGKNNSTNPKEGVTTREFPVKPNTDYEFTMQIHRAIYDDAWAWRDIGAYWNTQNGTVRYPDITDKEPNAHWWNNPFENTGWHSAEYTILNKGNDESIKTLRFEMPTWIRNGNATSIVGIDNVLFREKSGLVVGPTVATGFPAPVAPVLPKGCVNLIQNGDFESETINNNGEPFPWVLASEWLDNGDGTFNTDSTSNFPVSLNKLWNGYVRLQDMNKIDDFPDDKFYAHSGTKSLRFSTLYDYTLDNHNFDYAIQLESYKTYCFNFWDRSPNYNDHGTLKVSIGDSVVWAYDLNKNNNYASWSNANIIFTTTQTKNVLHLFTDAGSNGWWNIYFDDLVLFEVPSGYAPDPVIAGKENLIANGDFEDPTKDNNGDPFEWVLASKVADYFPAGYTDPANNRLNYPVKFSSEWGTYVRLQDVQKSSDTQIPWAHSGNNSLRFSYLDDKGVAQVYEGLSGDDMPSAYHANMNFKKDLEPNKTYTFVFWYKPANYGDKGNLTIANGDIALWKDDQLTNNIYDWTRQQITFSTTELDHALRMFTELGGWFNFYLDDLFLFEEPTYVPPVYDGATYLAFGKSTGTSGANVNVESITLNQGTVGIEPVNASNASALSIYPNPVVNGVLNINNLQSNGKVEIYSIIGTLVKVVNVSGTKASIDVSVLPSGSYIVKAGDKMAKMLKK